MIQTIEVGQVGKYYQMTSLASAVDVPGLPGGSGAGCRVVLQAVNQNARYVVNGTATTTFGMRLHATETHSINLAPGSTISIIEEAVSAEVNVTIYK